MRATARIVFEVDPGAIDSQRPSTVLKPPNRIADKCGPLYRPAKHASTAHIAGDLRNSSLPLSYVGGLIVRFGEPDAEPRYMELGSLEGVIVLAERSLLELLAAASVRETGLPFARHLTIWLERPERWIEFLEQCPARRA